MRSRLLKALAAVVAISLVAGVATRAASSPAKKQYRVVLLYPGTENDRTWGNAWADGVKLARQKLGVTISLVGGLETPDQYVAQGAAFGAKGYDLAIVAHGAMHDAAIKLAKQFPKTIWCQAPFEYPKPADQKKDPRNFCAIDIRQNHGSFLGGVVAGLVTKSNKVGAIGGFDFPALTRQLEAFALGARCVNSHVQIARKYINSFTDAGLAKAAAEAFIADGNDVLASMLDQAVAGVLQAARTAGHQVFVIPGYFDSWKLAPTVVLTTILHNIQLVAANLVQRGVQGKIPPYFHFGYGYANFNVGHLAPFHSLGRFVSPSARATLAKIEADIRSGKIKIPDAVSSGPGVPVIATANSSNKINVKSLGCKPVR
jgi:basic membrane protein A and related proteins